MKSIARYYDKLSAAERATLTIEALARKDMTDVDRLADSCPQFNYRGRELAYTLRLSEMHRLALLYACERHELMIRAICSIALIASADLENDDRAGELLERLDRLRANIAAWDTAWDAFCNTAGIKPYVVLAAYDIKLAPPDFSGLLGLDDCEPTAEILEEATLALIGMWQSVIKEK